jgi:hypothetical protein
VRVRPRPVLLGLAVLALAGCGGADPSAPEAAAEAFTRAAGGGDAAAACALLSPAVAEALAGRSGSCAAGVAEEPPPGAARVVRSERYGQQALVVTEADTIFLSRFPGGWKVIAAGCTAQGGSRPYDCTISEG